MTALSQALEDEESSPADISDVYLDESGTVIYDSIIENKSKIKSYWEQLMLTAELTSQPQTSFKVQHGSTATTVPVHSSLELDHIVLQDPELDTNTKSLKLTETVVERDIRLQKERELALLNERKHALEGVKSSVPKEIKKCNGAVNIQPDNKSQDTKSVDQQLECEIHSLGVRYGKETPIEQDIRLVRERDEELRRHRIFSNLSPSIPHNSEIINSKEVVTRQINEPSIQLTNAEIELVAEKEKDREEWKSQDLEKVIQTKSFPGVHQQNGDEKKNGIHVNNNDKLLKSQKNEGPSPKFYIQNPQQKGLMKRFLALRGKMGSASCLNLMSTPPSSLKGPATSPVSKISEPFLNFTSLVQDKDREEPVNLGTRPGYISAEDKIQSELQEMRRREEELRQQRRSNLHTAQSQPDLLNINGNFETDIISLSKDTNNSLPEIIDKPAAVKRRSALIEQWESRIQKENTD